MPKKRFDHKATEALKAELMNRREKNVLNEYGIPKITSSFSTEELDALIERDQERSYDSIIHGAESETVAEKVLTEARENLTNRYGEEKESECASNGIFAAAFKGYRKVAEKLLDNRSPSEVVKMLSQKDESNNTPEDIANDEEKRGMVRFLRNKLEEQKKVSEPEEIKGKASQATASTAYDELLADEQKKQEEKRKEEERQAKKREQNRKKKQNRKAKKAEQKAASQSSSGSDQSEEESKESATRSIDEIDEQLYAQGRALVENPDRTSVTAEQFLMDRFNKVMEEKSFADRVSDSKGKTIEL